MRQPAELTAGQHQAGNQAESVRHSTASNRQSADALLQLNAFACDAPLQQPDIAFALDGGETRRDETIATHRT